MPLPVCPCLCLRPSVSLLVCVSVYVSASFSVFSCMCICLCLCVSVYDCFCVYVCLYLCICLYPCTCLYLCIYLSMSTSVSVTASVPMSVYACLVQKRSLSIFLRQTHVHGLSLGPDFPPLQRARYETIPTLFTKKKNIMRAKTEGSLLQHHRVNL